LIPTKDDESKLITKSFGKENNILKGKSIPFLFNEYLYVSKELTNKGDDNMTSYFRTIRQDVKVALDIPQVLQTLEDYIDVLDRPADENKKKLLPRYKKLKRLESVYDLLVSFTLSLIHNFFWKDITLGCDKGAGTKNLSYRIQQVMPIVLKLKRDLESEIEHEYPHDAYEKQLFTRVSN
jgi:hypothetical protein